MSNTCKILIIEPSAIIREGLASIISEINVPTELSFLQDADDIFNLGQADLFKLILINPVVLSTVNPNSRKLQDYFNGRCLIGLVSTHYDRNTQNQFADTIFINDNEATIANTILKNIKTSSKEPNSLNTSLTEREIDVLKLLALGKSNKEIAESLFISIHTVISHRKNISFKLGVKSTAALVIYAVANNLIKLDDFN